MLVTKTITEIQKYTITNTEKEGSAVPDWSNQSVSNFFVHCMLKDILGLYKEGYCGIRELTFSFFCILLMNRILSVPFNEHGLFSSSFILREAFT